jgi:hypothetical protein
MPFMESFENEGIHEAWPAFLISAKEATRADVAVLVDVVVPATVLIVVLVVLIVVIVGDGFSGSSPTS